MITYANLHHSCMQTHSKGKLCHVSQYNIFQGQKRKCSSKGRSGRTEIQFWS